MVSLSALKCILVSLIDKSPRNSTQHLVSGEYQCNLYPKSIRSIKKIS